MLELERKKDYLVGIDSDGCAFDTMELKHKECFAPNFINFMELQGVSKYARETWEFVNLYSRSRGVNRFPALVETLDRLRIRPEVKARGVDVTVPAPLRDWVAEETRLGNPALERKVAATSDPVLRHVLGWSEAVNTTIAGMVRGVPPFPLVRDSILKLAERADVVVVSATPEEALTREWAEHGIDAHVRAIYGQESGTKKEHLALAENYPDGHVLMIGDAKGDHRAAAANNVLFFPINPGAEEASWQHFHDEGIERFFAGTFDGDYQEQLLNEFDKYLPEHPPWPVEAE